MVASAIGTDPGSEHLDTWGGTTTKETPVVAPAPGEPDSRQARKRLDHWSLALAIAAPLVGLVACALLQPGGQYAAGLPSSGSGDFTFYRFLAWIALLLYGVAMSASVAAIICGVIAFYRARRYPQPQRHDRREWSAIGVVAGLFYGALLVFPGVVLFYFFYLCATGAGCLEL